jgi:hypothetical protein
MREKGRLFFCLSMAALLIIWILVGCSEKAPEPTNNQQTNNEGFKLSDFSSASECQICHPTQYDEWNGSMHAYAFVDPVNTVWMNGLKASEGEETLGQCCVQCHSPIGMLTGETPIGFDKADVDPLVNEGINCDACHLMEAPSGTTFDQDIKYHYDVKSGKKYGSIMDPAPNGFHLSEGKQFYTRSNACLPCHDLINETGLRAEITYTEWVESFYNMSSVECQDCHMETYQGQAAVGGPTRDNLHRHDFIGVDMALIDNFPNKPEQRQRIEQLLQNSVTMTVELPDSVRPNSVLSIKATVTNDFVGHDIPSSVTFVRQMWLEVTVTSGADTLYKSGYFDANGDLMDAHSVLNPNGDPDLVIFQSALYKNGQPGNVFSADSINIGSIAPLQSKSGNYSISLNSILGNTIDVRVRLRFRTFPPYAIRDGAAQYIANIPTFEMEEYQGSIVVYP